MRFSIPLVLALVSNAVAASVARWHYPGFCLSDADASLLATEFGYTISNYTVELATQLFADAFTDQSDSVNQLIDSIPPPVKPLGSLTFVSKADFIAGQGAQPPVPFEILNTWHTCDTIIVRWLSAQTPDQVQGVSILTVEPAQPGQGGGFGAGWQKYQIIKVFAEFNSGAWLQNLGKPECATTSLPG